jgi:hypothetical protein
MDEIDPGAELDEPDDGRQAEAAASAALRERRPPRSETEWWTMKKPEALRHSVAESSVGGPYGESRSEAMQMTTSARSGRSSTVRAGRKPAAMPAAMPAAAMPSPIWVPAIEIGQKPACTSSPANASVRARRAVPVIRTAASPAPVACEISVIRLLQ